MTSALVSIVLGLQGTPRQAWEARRGPAASAAAGSEAAPGPGPGRGRQEGAPCYVEAAGLPTHVLPYNVHSSVR